jgi:hypothetical protein
LSSTEVPGGGFTLPGDFGFCPSWRSGQAFYSPWRALLSLIAILILIFLTVAGWFYLRNALLYDGDFLALQVMRETAGQRHAIPSLAAL